MFKKNHQGQLPQTDRASAFESEKFGPGGSVVDPLKMFLSSSLITVQNFLFLIPCERIQEVPETTDAEAPPPYRWGVADPLDRSPNPLVLLI